MQSGTREESWSQRFEAVLREIEEGVWVIRGLVDQLLDVWMSLEGDFVGPAPEGEGRVRPDRERHAGGCPGRACSR